MEIKVYVDVLLILNYIVNFLLLLCTAKLSGRSPKRRRMVAAALLGAGGSLTIFLPFFGFFPALFFKLALAAGIVRIAFPVARTRDFLYLWFVFFAVSFFFAGVMLALWVVFSPRSMLYYNGVVYFDISLLVLVVTTAVAYGALSLGHRLARAGRVRTAVYRGEITYRGKTAEIRGLVDTGNSLTEPFSGIPVMVCRLADVEPLLPEGAARAIRKGEHLTPDFSRFDMAMRLVPYGYVGGDGALPAFRPEHVRLTGPGGEFLVERVYIGIATKEIGGEGYNAVLNPDLVGIKL